RPRSKPLVRCTVMLVVWPGQGDQYVDVQERDGHLWLILAPSDIVGCDRFRATRNRESWEPSTLTVGASRGHAACFPYIAHLKLKRSVQRKIHGPLRHQYPAVKVCAYDHDTEL